MSAKIFFVLCASALFVNTISAQCIGYGNPGLGAQITAAELAGAAAASNRLGAGCGRSAYAAAPTCYSNGGGLTVTSASAIAPSGITIVSDNNIEGIVEIVGAAPVLAGVGFEGNLPTAGSAGTSYSCGNGNIGIAPESLAAAGIGAGVGAYGPGRIGLGAANAANFAAANYGAVNFAGAEIAGINAGLAAGRLNGPGCGRGNIY